VQPDPDLRDNENVPLPALKVTYEADVDARLGTIEYRSAIDDYMTAEVHPYVPDAWVDHDKTKIGYEIPLTRHFYTYTPPSTTRRDRRRNQTAGSRDPRPPRGGNRVSSVLPTATPTGWRRLRFDRVVRRSKESGKPDFQRAIADYLDAETARIDALITKKRRMIDLLRKSTAIQGLS
jgi:hypothetical protein